MTEYAKIESTADGTHLYVLPPASTEQDWADRDNIMGQLRALHDVPEDWQEHPDRGRPWTRSPGGTMIEPIPMGWDVAILEDPHPSIISREGTVVHPPEDTPAPHGG